MDWILRQHTKITKKLQRIILLHKNNRCRHDHHLLILDHIVTLYGALHLEFFIYFLNTFIGLEDILAHFLGKSGSSVIWQFYCVNSTVLLYFVLVWNQLSIALSVNMFDLIDQTFFVLVSIWFKLLHLLNNYKFLWRYI